MKFHLLFHVTMILLIVEIFQVVVSWDSNEFEYDNFHRNRRVAKSHVKTVLDVESTEELTVISSNVQNDIKLIKIDVNDKKQKPDNQEAEEVDNEVQLSRLFLINIADNPAKKVANNLTAIVHIGPQKTGSSSIQQFLKKNLLDDIILDHYERVPDPNPFADYSFVGCFDILKAPISKSLGNDDYSCHQSVIQNTINISINRNNNLLITSETIPNGKFNISLFQQFINQYWNRGAIIIAYYRRFYSWIYSLHNQQTKLKPVLDQSKIVDYVSNIKFIDQIYRGYYFNGTVQRFQQYYTNPDSLRLYSLHHDLGNMSLIEHFFCVAAPELSNSCEKSRQVINEKAVIHSNGAEDLVYMELAYYAKELNLLSPDTMNKVLKDPSLLKNLANSAKIHQEAILKLPVDDFGNKERTLSCPTNDTYQYLLNLTVLAEKKFFPQYFNESDIIHDFQTQYVMKNKFCHVNASLVLYYNLNGWKNFFESLVL